MKAEVLNDDLLPAINKAVAGALSESFNEELPSSALKTPILTTKMDDTSPVKAFLEGKHCLTGVSVGNKTEKKMYRPVSILTENYVFFREPVGGNMNSATVAMFVNSTWIKPVKPRSCWATSMKNYTNSGSKRIPKRRTQEIEIT